ncbi:FAD-binding oxidoreductase [Moraxella nasovis]|uniref:L-pipecolate oxidase n=1 Tax=Moraxella nasovis TaxID=2904121 RepID=UPI001F6009B8|nr:FAD-binding oxidoreductase [Moraxella nasovis]UNU72657.1 FAD-binding oxidoreductase [Moraxella nasovis]
MTKQIKEHCLWHDTAPKTVHYPPLTDDITADVCVVGGGYTGLSAAIHLAEFGYSVCVLESDYIGKGGSGRNVGYVNAGTWSPPDELNAVLGEMAGEKLTKILGDAPRLVFEMIDKYHINAQDTRTGNIHMAHNANMETDIDNRVAQFKRRGVDVEVLTGSKCHEMTGTTKINKALLDKRAGTINPFAYVDGLAKSAIILGVKIFENTKAHSLTKDGDSWQVACDGSDAKASVKAKKVILATNAYSDGEWLDIQKSFYHVQFYQIASEPLDNAIANQILAGKQGSWDTCMALSSIRRDNDGRLILGTVGGRAFKPDGFYQKWADGVVAHYYPDLPRFDWQCQWFGYFGFTTDHIMRVFAPADGILAATAYNGRGITTGTMMGKAFAKFIKTDNPDVLPLPFYDINDSQIAFKKVREIGTELGLTLYHGGQILKIVA